jgi:hypothetical protein
MELQSGDGRQEYADSPGIESFRRFIFRAFSAPPPQTANEFSWHDLDLGKRLALRFAAERLAHCYGDVETCFRQRGAYGRFKELLAEERSLEEWCAFEAESTERALREWCAANGIELMADGTEQSA